MSNNAIFEALVMEFKARDKEGFHDLIDDILETEKKFTSLKDIQHAEVENFLGVDWDQANAIADEDIQFGPIRFTAEKEEEVVVAPFTIILDSHKDGFSFFKEIKAPSDLATSNDEVLVLAAISEPGFSEDLTMLLKDYRKDLDGILEKPFVRTVKKPEPSIRVSSSRDSTPTIFMDRIKDVFTIEEDYGVFDEFSQTRFGFAFHVPDVRMAPLPEQKPVLTVLGDAIHTHSLRKASSRAVEGLEGRLGTETHNKDSKRSRALTAVRKFAHIG